MLTDRHVRGEIAGGSESREQAKFLAEVIERIREEYVDPLDEDVLIDNAVEGILQDLDNHSRLLGEDDYENIRINTTGQYAGVGLDISLEEGEVRVVAPLDDTPAHRAGILPGDVVVSVDDVPVDKENTEATVNRMRGQPGTLVILDVMRDGSQALLRFALTGRRSTSKPLEPSIWVKVTPIFDSQASPIPQVRNWRTPRRRSLMSMI